MRVFGIITIFLVFLSAAFARADEAGDQFAVAASHYDAKRWKLAGEEFQVFLDKFPAHPNVDQCLFYQAEALLQLARYDASHKKFQEYLKREPAGGFARTAMFRSGEAAFLAGTSDLAEKELGAFVKKYPEDRLNGFALPYLGDIAADKKDYPLAESYFREGLDRFPENGLQDDCRFGLARALDKQNKFEEAEKLYLALSKKTDGPLAENAFYHLGAMQYAAGKYAAALVTFQALENRWPASPRKANARLGRGWALMKLNRLDEAYPIFQSLASDPKLGVEARYWQGLVQKARHEWLEAAKTLLDTAAAAQGHELLPAIRFHAGDALLQAGNLKAANEQFDLVLAASLFPLDEGSGAKTESPAIIPPPPGSFIKSERTNPNQEWREQAARGKAQTALLAKNYAAVDREAENFAKQYSGSILSGDVARIHARSLLAQKQYDRAAAALEPLLAQQPPGEQEWETRYLLAAAEEGSRKYDLALQMLAPVVDGASGRLKTDAQLLRGSVLLAMRRYAEAASSLEAYLRSDPSGDGVVQAAGQLAICYVRGKHLEKAKKLYADLKEKYPQHPLLAPATEQLAEAAFDADDAEWSAELSSSLMEMGKRKSAEARSASDPRQSASPPPEAAEYERKGLAGLGWSQYKAGQLNEAAATFERVLQMQPPEALAAEVAYARGQVLEKLERFDPALAIYDLVVEKYPKTPQHPDAIYAAARLRMKLRQNREAAALYERLARDCPKYAKLDAVLYDWAWTLRELGELAEADKIYWRLKKDFPKSRYWADATCRLAQRAFDNRELLRANSLLDELLAAKPEPPLSEFALYLRAQIELSGKDWSKIRLAFMRLLDEFPQSHERLLAEFWIAESDYREKNYDEAEKRLDGISQRIPGRQEPWMAMIALRRAQIALYRKNWDDAFTLAAGIEKNFPDFCQQYEADLVIGRCLANHAEFEEARNAYGKVIRSPAGEKTETAAMAQWLIGETFFHQKNYDAALREYLRVDILYAYPAWQALALVEAAKCHELLRDYKQAEQCYRKILDRYGNTPSAKDAKQRIQEVTKELEEEKKKQDLE